MSNKLETVAQRGGDELSRLKGVIKQYDDGFHRAYRSQMGYAFLAGVALNRAKELLPHGEFLPWVESEVGVARMSASRYRKFADALIEEHPAVGKCNPCYILNSGESPTEELTAEETEKVCRAVHKIADGKTLTEMYRDLGVIRQPEKPKHHPRKAGNAAVTHAEKKQNSLDFTNAWRGPLRVWLTVQAEDDGEHVHLDRVEWEATLEILTEASAMVRARLKGGAL